MGISIQEILSAEFFKDFEIIAGRKGIHKEVQGITSMEAPDCFKWTKGRELVLSSGYVISQEPDCLKAAFEEGLVQQSSGMMIKKERYLKEIPNDIIDLFNTHCIPLILAPFTVSWMDISNNINVLVMNRAISRFTLGSRQISPINLTYKEKQIKRMLRSVESELGFPAYLYDLREDRSYSSSVNFERATKDFGISGIEFADPPLRHTKTTLCDFIGMKRIRLIDNEEDIIRTSWIVIPIVVDGAVQAYFVVMEARELLDYFDEYSIRIAYLMIQAVYEQIVEAQKTGDIGFENFIHYATTCPESELSMLPARAAALDIGMSSLFSCAVFCNEGKGSRLVEMRKTIIEAFYSSPIGGIGRIAFLDNEYGVILIENKQFEEAEMKTLLEKFLAKVKEDCGISRITCGICRDLKPIAEVRKSIRKCINVIRIGKMILPGENMWDYETLGPLAWIDIPDEEVEHMLNRFSALNDEHGRELLATLKCYLEHNLNYSQTAEAMYVHINTVRKRIDRLVEEYGFSWDSKVEQMKLTLLLQMMDLQ